jgi:GDP-L-fucose synthase
LSFWGGKNVLVTGGSGFVGRHLVRFLGDRGATVSAPSHAQYDLVQQDQVTAMYEAHPDQDIVIHLAARVGGIGANRASPGSFFYDNLVMGVQLLHHAHLRRIPKFVAIGTVCAYPKVVPLPFREEDLWNGYPEETNAPYGLAKKMMLVQSQAYREQYGFNSIFLLLVNLYGPGDNFNPDSSHVIPALVKKCVDAVDIGADEIVVWGDGSATREFLFVGDAVEGIASAAERYDKSEPVNLGSAVEISIRELVELIAAETGFNGRITWDQSKPNGQPRRKLDVGRAEAEFGFRSRTGFEEGLRATIRWYLEGRARPPGSSADDDAPAGVGDRREGSIVSVASP